MRLIDADTLKEIIGECPENWTDSPEEVEAFNMWHRIMDDIDSTPTVKPDFWISVEERLPDDSMEVLVLLKIKDVLVPDMGVLISGNWWSTMSYNMMVGDPLFWAEIPRGPDNYK